MKKTVTLLVLTAASSAFASVFWRGTASEPHGWADDDNPASGSGGFYWNTADDSGSGTWQQTPVEENAHVQNGGIVVIGDGVTADLGGYKLVLNYNCNTKTSEVRVAAGGLLTNCVGYVSHSFGSFGLLHVVGGKAYIDVGASGKDAGLWVPSSDNMQKDASGEVRVDGGLLSVAKEFCIAGSYWAGRAGQSALLAISDGEVVARCALLLGRNEKTSLARGSFVQTGGTFTGLNEKTGVQVGEKSSAAISGGAFGSPHMILFGGLADFTGGTADIGRVYVEAGSTLRFGGDTLFNGAFSGPQRDRAAVAGVTNVIVVTGGSVTATNNCFNINGNYGWFGGQEPMRYVQTGGFVTNDNLYVRSDDSGNLRMSIEGGVFYVTGKFSFFGHPFYFKTKGTPEVSFDEFPMVSAVNKNDAATNCVLDHVIDSRGLSPLVFRTSNRVFGRHVLRPSGGLQVVSTNRFALVRVPNELSMARVCFGCVPDETLWTTKAFGDGLGNWGSTLKPEADCGAAIGKSGGVRTFSARPSGYLDLPSIPSNRFESATVKLKVTPLDATIAEVAAGLAAEGYANVREIAEENANLAFEIPAGRYPDACGTTKLLFDFTEPIIPDTFVDGPMEFPVRTNALVSACSVDIATKKQGLVLIVR